MDTRRALLVDAFTADPLTGNAAGVVPDASGLTEAQMQAVARELAVSETAFVFPAGGAADRRVRYFTPRQEVDLCGHATIASVAHLYEDGVFDAETYALETSVGVIDVDVTSEGVVWMTQDSPTVRPVDLDYERAGEALGIPPSAMRDVGADLPAAVASTGMAVLVVPVNFLEHLSGADPDPTAIASLADAHDAVGVYVFTFDALDAASTLHARFFAPGVGVPEDPVTGTASGACGAYLRARGAFDAMPEEMRFEQGHFVDRPGHVLVRATDTVQVGGRAVTTLDGTIAVPDREDDDIIEA